MKKLILLLMFLSFEGYSQEFLGKAYYMSKSTVNMDWMKNMSPERQKYMKARMKTALEKNYILDFDSKSSYFKEEVTLDAGGSGGGTEILFNMDYMFAQQAYFGAMMGGFGYDITTWHMLKEWMDLRKKMFATQVYVNFNPTTQLLKLTPEPQTGFTSGRGQYIGVVGCRLEKSVKELVQERWVQRYALALAKISLAHIRGKFGGVTLFGGGQVNATDLMTQGLEERKTLEEELMNGFGEAEPPLFFIE